MTGLRAGKVVILPIYRALSIYTTICARLPHCPGGNTHRQCVSDNERANYNAWVDKLKTAGSSQRQASPAVAGAEKISVCDALFKTGT